MNLDMDTIHPQFPYYNREGEPISLRTWADHCEDMSYKKLADTQIRAFRVSTIWVGIDMEIIADVPVIFETAILGRGLVIRGRYATERQARIGHSNTCRMIHSGWRPHSASARRREARSWKQFRALVDGAAKAITEE